MTNSSSIALGCNKNLVQGKHVSGRFSVKVLVQKGGNVVLKGWKDVDEGSKRITFLLVMDRLKRSKSHEYFVVLGIKL